MKALVLSAYNQLNIADVATPLAGPLEVVIRVEACGICGSDVHGYDGSSGRRIPPITMGHEAAGIISVVGHDVKKFKAGDRATFDSTVYCGHCDYCVRGEVNLCDNRQVVGVSCGDYRREGAFAEYVRVPEHIVYKLPDNLSFAEAAMLEAVSVALHAVRISSPHGRESALVVGAGMIGLLTLQATKAMGYKRVFVADVDATRLALATEVGADEVIHASGPDSGKHLLAAVMKLTRNKGVDVAFEAVGRNETIATAIDAVRKGGTVTLIGNITPEVTLPLQKVVTREIRLQGSAASAGEYPLAIELMVAGKIQVRPLITAVAPLEDGPEWFARLHAREPNLMKVVLSPALLPGEARRGDAH